MLVAATARGIAGVVAMVMRPWTDMLFEAANTGVACEVATIVSTRRAIRISRPNHRQQFMRDAGTGRRGDVGVVVGWTGFDDVGADHVHAGEAADEA